MTLSEALAEIMLRMDYRLAMLLFEVLCLRL